MLLQTQYKEYLKNNPDSKLTYQEWLGELSVSLAEAVKEFNDWDVTLMDGLENEPPYVSNDFQIGPDGAYEHTEEHETIAIQQQLIDVLYTQMIDLSMMSKIELGDDVIAEIKRLKELLSN